MKKIVSALLVSAAALSAPAFAVGFDDGQVGSKYAAADIAFTSYGGSSATGLNIGGGYQFHPAMAVEVDYLMGGKYTYSLFGVNATTEVNALQVWLVGHYTIDSQFGAYAKVGISHNSAKATVVMPLLGPVTGTATSNDFAFAIGGTYKVNSQFSVRVQYQDVGAASTSVMSIGATYSF